jgi:hypothetical protein
MYNKGQSEETKMTTWTKDQIKEQLQKSDKWVLRAVCAIHAKQTAEEKSAKITRVYNGIGFNGIDAEILSSFAEQIQKRGFLTQNKLLIARRRIVKYAGQLARIANEKEAEKERKLENEMT